MRSSTQRLWFLAALVCASCGLSGCSGRTDGSGEENRAAEPSVLRHAEVGSVINLHTFGRYYLAGQPAAEDFSLLNSQGVRMVINLRTDPEMTQFDEPTVVSDLGMKYHSIPFRSAEGMTDEVLDRSRALLDDPGDGAVLLHCASANRVGAVWMTRRVLDDGVPYDEALAEAKQVGLRSQALIDRATDYIRMHQTESGR